MEASRIFDRPVGYDFQAQTFTPVGLDPVPLDEDGLPDYERLAQDIAFDLDQGKLLLENWMFWRAHHFPVSDTSAPFADFQSWIWRWWTSGCRKITLCLPAEHGKSTELNRYLLWRLLRCNRIRIGLFHKEDDQAADAMIAIQSMLAHPEFIRLYGIKRPPKNLANYPWSAKRMRFADNPDIGEVTHNMHAYTVGARAGALGKRFHITAEDDVNTPDNTATPALRMKTRTWQSQVVDKTMAAKDSPDFQCDCGGHGQQLRVGTAFWPDDSLMHTEEIANIKIGPREWDEPEGLSQGDKEKWVFIRKSCWDGMVPERTLWQFRYKKKKLEEMRDEDPTQLLAFARRMENETRRLEDIKFDEAWFIGGTSGLDGKEYPGCLDHDRALGERPPRFEEMVRVSATDPVAGLGRGDSLSAFASVVMGQLPRGKRRYIIDLYQGRLKMSLGHDWQKLHSDPVWSPPEMLEQYPATQIGTLISRHHRYGCEKSLIENNGQQGAWVEAVKDIDEWVDVDDINTDERKWSPDVGIPSLVPLIQLGLLRIPYRDEVSQRFAAKLIEQFFKWEGNKKTQQDIVMVVWLATMLLKGDTGVIDMTGATSIQSYFKRKPIATRAAM